MSEKILKGRSVQKHDTEANWLKATNFIPKQGEIIVYDVDANHDYERMKIGDGKTVVSSLPFIESSKADKATEANHATTADSATKDDSGNVITTTYETKIDAAAKLTEAKEYAVNEINTAINAIPQSNWTQNDASEADYIQNRTHYVISSEEGDVIYEATVSGFQHDYDDIYITSFDAEIPEYLDGIYTFKVIWDGVEYICENIKNNGLYLMNPSVILGNDNFEGNTNGEPFCIYLDTDNQFIRIDTNTSGATHTLKIIEIYEEVKPLSSKYIPSDIAKLSDVADIAYYILDTVDSKASQEELDTVKGLVGDTAVSAQIETAVANKVDKVAGKGLSTNDYTTVEKNKLAGIDEGANKTIVDSALSNTSANPVQNKVVNAAISNLSTLVGDTSVADQIAKAVENIEGGTVTKAEHATTADSATHATSADEATHATSADKATKADSATKADAATKATQDASGNVITTTYETKVDAAAKLTEAKEYATELNDSIAEAFANTLIGMFGDDYDEETASVPTIREIANDEATTASNIAKTYVDSEIAEWVGDETVSIQIANAIVDKADKEHIHLLNDITDAPFDVVGGDTLTWDGNTDGLYNILGIFYHVSDTVPTIEDLKKGGVITYSTPADDAGDYTFYEESVIDLEAMGAGKDCYIIMAGTIYAVGVVLKEGATATLEGMSATFEKAGVYFIYTPLSSGENRYTSKFTINGYDGFTKEILFLDALPEHSHDDKYYTETEIDTKFSNMVGDTSVSTQISTAIANKVDKVSGKGLSTNDLTAVLKTNYDAAYTHISKTDNPHSVTKAQVGLGNVENKSSATIRGEITSANVTTALGYTPSKNDHTHNYIPTSEKGVASGVATLDTNGKVPSSQLPSYVDDVLEYAKKASFPATGETGKIYIDQATNKTYRWSGSAYTEISASLALGETSSTAYAGDKGKANATAIAALQTKVGDSTVASQISTAIAGKSDTGHKHTKSEITDFPTSLKNPNALTIQGNGTTLTNGTYDGSAAKTVNITPSSIGAAASSHGNHVPAIETANNAKFLRNDNTWATVTPANIGAAASSHGTHVTWSTTTPKANGAAAVGSETKVARGDHVHPTDTTRASASELTALKGLVGDTAVATQISNAIGSTKYAGSSSAGGAATSANKVNKSLTVKLNGGTTEGTNLFTFNGSAAKTVNITPSSIGASASNHTHNMLKNNYYSDVTGTVGLYASSKNIFYLSAPDGATYEINLGKSDRRLNNIYADNINGEGRVVCNRLYIPNGNGLRGKNANATETSIEQSQCIGWVNGDNNVVLGDHESNTGHTFVRCPSGKGTYLQTNGVTTRTDSAGCIQFAHIESAYYFRPSLDATTRLGSASYKWGQIYSSKETISTSDRNLKKNIQDLDDRYIELFDLIRPVSYQLLKGDRLHTGFIAQEVEDAMEKVGLSAEELGFFCKDIKVVADDENETDVPVLDEEGNPVYIYSLRYSEYIAIMAEKVRRQDKKIKELESKIVSYEERLTALENKL